MNESTNTIRPSEQRVWEKYYAAGAHEQLQQPLPEGTLWNGLIEPALRAKGDRYDALVYFGNRIRRSQLIAIVERWARMLRSMDVGAGDQILIFSPIIPEALYAMFAANKIGAIAILPNLAANHQTLVHAADRVKVAFVFDDMEPALTDILATEQFKHVVLLSATHSMPAPLSVALGLLDGIKKRSIYHRSSKYITTRQALKRFNSYRGALEAPRSDSHASMFFSSGGTTKDGTAKLIGITDSAMLTMFRSALAYNLGTNPFCEGSKSLALAPPFVCTGFFVTVLAPLYRGMTVYLEPRLDQQHFNEAMLRVRPQITLMSGCLWAGFFRAVEQRAAKGEKIDLSNLVLPIMGGEGCTPETLEWMDSVAFGHNAKLGIVSGYGMSEAFSVITIDYRPEVRNKRDDHLAISVGYPFPGTTVAIRDEQGNELPYGHRGELCAKTPSMMKEYLNNPELTAHAIGDGWIHSGDLCEMSPDGLVYLYGRMHEHIVAPNGQKVYIFDIANQLRQDPAVENSLAVLVGDHTDPRIAVHLILSNTCTESHYDVLRRLDDTARRLLPEGIDIKGYQIHKGPFAVSPITKTNRNYYSRLLTGYVLPRNGELQKVEFSH